MGIMTTVMPAKVKFAGTKIDVHRGDDITPALNQKFIEIPLKNRFSSNKITFISSAELGFDIETTTTKNGAFMYKWQLVFGEYLFSGRTWDEWCFVMEAIERAYNLGTSKFKSGKKHITHEHLMVLWIANQGYEFQFFHLRQWNNHSIVQREQKTDKFNVFADSMRRPLKTMLSFTNNEYGGAFAAYDALKFSTSLGQLAKDYGITSKKKKTLADGTVVSDLDYSIPRNSMTPLNNEEEEYCDADVAILYEWAHYYNDAYVSQNRFAPMTSTGIIRQAVVESYDANTTHADHVKTFDLHPTLPEYVRAINHLYRGGFTYANRSKVGRVLKKVRGMDFTSSYPAVMLQGLFPVSSFTKKTIRTEDELEAWIAKNPDKCWYADFHFTQIIQTKGVSVENMFKLHEYKSSPAQCKKDTGCVVDNGKVAYAREMTVTLCEHDWDTYKKFYRWQNVSVSLFSYADSGHLPAWFTDVLMFYYKKKADLKKAGMGGTTEYALAKAVVNGLYGLTVQKIHFDAVVLNDAGWETNRLKPTNPDDILLMEEIYEKSIGRDKKSMKRNKGVPKVVLSPYWGIWCTAIARNRILNAINELGQDFVYCDTDSVYMENYDDHKSWFDAWNDRVHTWNAAYLKDPAFFTLGDFDPVCLDEKIAPDVNEYCFKTQGAKRYIKWSGDKLHATVAGLPHGSLQKRAKAAVGKDAQKQVDWIVENFESGLKVAAEEAMKNAHMYIDEPVDDLVEDLYGNKEYMHEESCMVIYPIEFTMKLDPDYEKIAGMPVDVFLLRMCYSKMQDDDGSKRRIQ